jgi:hypothetical protein
VEWKELIKPRGLLIHLRRHKGLNATHIIYCFRVWLVTITYCLLLYTIHLFNTNCYLYCLRLHNPKFFILQKKREREREGDLKPTSRVLKRWVIVGELCWKESFGRFRSRSIRLLKTKPYLMFKWSKGQKD